MKVYVASDQAGLELKETIKAQFSNDYTIEDLTIDGAEDFVESSKLMVEALNAADEEDLGILFDAYGVGSFMASNKHKGMIVAEISDERSAYMTREHNNTRLITLGSKIFGKQLAKNIVKEFLTADYDGGRHQVRVDMLNEMC